MIRVIATFGAWAADALLTVGKSGRAHVMRLENFERDTADGGIETPSHVPASVLSELRLDALVTYHRTFGVLRRVNRRMHREAI